MKLWSQHKGIQNLLFAVVLSLSPAADAAYGVKWTPGDTNSIAGAYLIAVNAFELQMRQPDGKIRVLRRDFGQPTKLYGEPPWVGEEVGNGIFKVLTNPEFKGGRTGFVFKDGHLRRMILGRKDYQFEQMSYPVPTNTLESLWPKELSSQEARELFGTWNKDTTRLRLGFVNPNKAGCLCAELVLVGIGLMLFFTKRKWCVVCGAAVSIVAFALLTLTASRGGLLACVAGVVVLLAFRGRRLFSLKWFAIVAAMGVLAIGIVSIAGLTERFKTKLIDTSGETDAFRVNVWRAAPKMMVDSPSGWGLGVSGRAYTSWYQAPDEFKVIRTLVNSHITWLVECGWIGRFLYLAALFTALWYLGVFAWRGGNPLPLALLVSLLVAGMFNSVMESPVLWLLPVASLAFLLDKRKSVSTGRDWVRSLCVGGGLAALVLLSLSGYGLCSRSNPPIRASHGQVVVNGSSAKTWVVDDGVVLGGGFLGKELRLFYETFPSEPAMGIVWHIRDLPVDVEHLVLAGKSGVDFLEKVQMEPGLLSRFKTITFISPPFAASSLPPALVTRAGVKIIQGELATLRTSDAQSRPDFLEVISGAELYIPIWMKYALLESDGGRLR